MNIMQFLMKHWDIAGRTGLSVEAQQAQEDVCKLQARYPIQAPRPASYICCLGSELFAIAAMWVPCEAFTKLPRLPGNSKLPQADVR